MSCRVAVSCCGGSLQMSALGQKQTCALQKAMSALPLKGDLCDALAHFRSMHKAASKAACALRRYPLS
jgi:hypothetical protein